MTENILVAIIGVCGVVVGVILSYVASLFTDRKAFKRAKTLFLFEKQVEVYPKALVYIKTFATLSVWMNLQLKSPPSSELVNDDVRRFRELESQQHEEFFYTFWSVAPKRVRNEFQTLKQEISSIVKSESMPAEKVAGYAYERLSEILNISN